MKSPPQQYGPPANIFSLGIQQFNRNLNAMRGEYLDEKDTSKLDVPTNFFTCRKIPVSYTSIHL
jgi:hypothetical protein